MSSPIHLDPPPAVIITMAKPPSTNKLWRIAGGKRVRSEEYATWRNAAGWEVKRQHAGRPPVACRYNLEIQVPISRRDTDNWVKPISDILETCGVITNDGNAHEVKITPMERDDCAVAIYELPGMGGIRPQAKPRWDRGGRKAKPSAKRIKKFERIREEVLF